MTYGIATSLKNSRCFRQFSDQKTREELREYLGPIYDLERLITRITYQTAKAAYDALGSSLPYRGFHRHAWHSWPLPAGRRLPRSLYPMQACRKTASHRRPPMSGTTHRPAEGLVQNIVTFSFSLISSIFVLVVLVWFDARLFNPGIQSSPECFLGNRLQQEIVCPQPEGVKGEIQVAAPDHPARGA